MSNEVATITPLAEQYPVLAHDEASFNELVRMNLGATAMSPRSFKAVGMPRGGITVFVVPTSGGEEEVKEIHGVVVYRKMEKARYATAYNPAEPAPPVCSSQDGGVTGVDADGLSHACSTCPFNKFTKDEATGKSIPPKCGTKMAVYLVTPGNLFPMRLQIPATSLRVWDEYVGSLTGENRHLFEVVTCFTATKDESKTSGNKCSRLVITRDKDIAFSPEEKAVWRQLHHFVDAALSRPVVADGDITVDED